MQVLDSFLHLILKQVDYDIPRNCLFRNIAWHLTSASGEHQGHSAQMIKVCLSVMDKKGDWTVEKNSIDCLGKAFRSVILSAE